MNQAASGRLSVRPLEVSKSRGTSGKADYVSSGGLTLGPQRPYLAERPPFIGHS